MPDNNMITQNFFSLSTINLKRSLVVIIDFEYFYLMNFDMINAVKIGTAALIKAAVRPCKGLVGFGLNGTVTVLPSPTFG
jgi:hypothetical protein